MALETGLKRGVTTNYGPRKTTLQYGSANTLEYRRTAKWVFNYDELPAAGTNNQQQVIPAGSTIVQSRFRVITPFTSTSTTTDLDVGLAQSDGTAIDADGLLTAANLTQTVIGVAGDWVSGTGALNAHLSSATYNGELTVTPTANDLTAGRAEIYVEYLLPAASQQV